MLVSLTHAVLPTWMDRFLDPIDGGDFFSTRIWFDTVLKAAMPQEGRPLVALDGEPGKAGIALPLLAQARKCHSLTTPYSLAWRPLFAAGADAAAQITASTMLGSTLRPRSPLILDLIDAEDARLVNFCEGLRRGRLHISRFDHIGNWHEVLPPDVGWDAYLASRPSTLRSTVVRKVARASRTLDFELVSAPGDRLDKAIADYEDVRAHSWKPDEPFPAFDGELLRAAAPAGVARVGVLRRKRDGQPVAAQYWIIDRPEGAGARRRATVLKLAHLETERAASPGTVLTAMMIRELLETDGVRILDFGRGDDPYKQLWVGQRRQRVGLLIVDPWRVSGAVALGRQMLGGLRRRLRRG